MRRFLITIVGIVALPGLAAAQRGGMAAGGHAAVAARPAGGMVMGGAGFHSGAHVATAARGTGGAVVVHRARPGSGLARNANGVVVRTGPSRGFNGGFPGAFPMGATPGLGFDFAHFAAVHPRNGNQFRGRRIRGANFGGGGFFLGGAPLIVEDGGAESAEAAEGTDEGQYYPDPNVASRDTDLRARETYDSSAGAEPRAAAPGPQRDLNEYVFVRRDGAVVFAVAYSWDNGTLRYVTREGLRRSIARDALDLNATQQFNEQRGTSFVTPAA